MDTPTKKKVIHDNRRILKIKINVIANNIDTFIKKEIRKIKVQFEEIKPKKEEVIEERDIFLLNLMKKYSNGCLEKPYITWIKGQEIVHIPIRINNKNKLFKFYLTENKTIFKEVGGNSKEVKVEIGLLDNPEKFIFLENEIYNFIASYRKGTSNEEIIISAAKDFAKKYNYTVIVNDALDDEGVDCMLIDNFFKEEFYLQAKSSYGYVEDAKAHGKGFYKGKEIIFIIAYKNMKKDDYVRKIYIEINKQKNNLV